VIALRAGPAWWRQTLAELQEREAGTRRRARELRLELDAAGVELARMRAQADVAAERLAATDTELRSLTARHDRLTRRLAAAESTRAFRLSQRWWRLRAAVLRGFGRH
jgi:chromosome segregation ATPase